MKIFFAILFVIFTFSNFVFSQEKQTKQDTIHSAIDSTQLGSYFINATLLQPRSSERGIPMKTQSQIDEMQVVAQGYMVFNTTTGCLNYYFGKNWYQLCGECIPQPKIPSITKIEEKASKLLVHFNPIKMDSIIAYVGKYQYVSYQSPLAIYLREKIENPVPIQLRVFTICGYIDTTLTVNLNYTTSVSPVLIEEIDGKKIRYRKYGNCKWMVDDWQLDKPIAMNSPYWISMENTKNPCPKGWLVPTENDWKTLLEHFDGNYMALFEKPTDQNLSLGLNKRGIYGTQEKKLIIENISSYYVGDKNNKKQKLINLSENGYIIPEEDPKLFMLPLRCIQCEK